MEAIATIRTHPMARALRIDGPTQGALVATLEAYAGGAGETVPFWAMASLPIELLQARSVAFAEAVGEEAEVVESHSVPGAGSVPGELIPSPAVRIAGNADRLDR